MLIVRFFQDSRCAATTDGRIYVPMDRVTSPESVVTSVEVYGNAVFQLLENYKKKDIIESEGKYILHLYSQNKN